MRAITNINDNWFFKKTEELPSSLPETWERVVLPHTWNNADGMAGGNDY